MPEVPRDQFTARALREGILRHGCLLVRGLVDHARIEPLVEGINRAFDGYDAHERGAPASATAPWFVPFEPGAGEVVIGRAWDPLIPRGWARDAGGVMTVDSPRTAFRTIEALDEARVGEVLGDYFGEPPALSVKKSTLRRTLPDSRTWWHQDGAFLGADIRSVNVWLALSHCGDFAPGLDLIPQRFDRILETGSGDAEFDWSIGSDVIEREARGTGVVRPIFEPGDALLFDERLPHSTAVSAEMNRDRFAIETWFFAPIVVPGRSDPPRVLKHSMSRSAQPQPPAIAEIRARHPGFLEALAADARLTAKYRGERSTFHSTADLWVQALRLMLVSDAFLGQVLYRAKAAMQRRGIPVIPRLAHRLAMATSQVCIGDPVVVAPGVYFAHGQVVVDGFVEIGTGVVLFPWVTIGLLAGNYRGPTIEAEVHIGTGAKVIGPVTVGAGARIGANSVVLDDVPAGATAVGLPARIV